VSDLSSYCLERELAEPGKGGREMVMMDNLSQAVNELQVLQLSMRRDPPGSSRIGEPHVLYRSSRGTVLLHIYQIGGYSSSGKPPAWRQLKVQEILSAQPTGGKFELRWNEGYNPGNRKFYRQIICCAE